MGSSHYLYGWERACKERTHLEEVPLSAAKTVIIQCGPIGNRSSLRRCYLGWWRKATWWRTSPSFLNTTGRGRKEGRKQHTQHFVGRKALDPGREAPFSCSLPPVPSLDKAWHCSPGKGNIYLIQLPYLQAGHRWLQLGLRDNKLITGTGGEVKVGLKRGESKGWSGWVAGKIE